MAKVISKSTYPGNRGFDNIYLRFPWGYVFFNTKYPTKKLLVKGRKTNTTFTGKPYHDVKCKSEKYKNLAMTYARCQDSDMAIDMTFGGASDSERRRWKRTIRTKAFKNMVRDELQKLLQDHGLTEGYTLELLEETIKKAKDKGELQKLLQDHGLTEGYTLELLEETIKKAKDKGDITNLMRAVDNLQDMHGMKDKHLVKTTDKIEATNTTTLIDDIREEEQKLVATRTTVEPDKDE